MDDVQEMMEGLAIDESSSFYVDFEYEFNASQFFDFCVNETDYEVREAESWFVCAPQYPPAPYMVKIKLTNLSMGTPAKDNATSSMKVEVVEHVTPSIVTPSDCGIPSSEEKTQATASSLSVRDLLDDIQRLKAHFKESAAANRSPKPSTILMKPTASHLAKQINAEDTHAGSCGRSLKLQTPTGSVTEDPKRQKLEIGFLRKVSQLKHQTSYSHKTATKAGSKTTIPRQPRLLTEERARRRRSQSTAETYTHTFKALPLNRKIFDSPSMPIRKKIMTDSPVFQKFHFKYDN